MIKSILVPTDFSDCSSEAFKSAQHMALKVNAEIVLLHVLPELRAGIPLGETEEWNAAGASSEEVLFMLKLLKERKKKMKKFIATHRILPVTVKDVIEAGEVNEKINYAAGKYAAGAIVMGTHGANGLNELFVGSTASHVVRDAEIPVISIADGALQKIETIVFATDFSEETNLVFPFVQLMAQKFGAKVHLLKIVVDSDMSGVKKAKSEAIEFEYENNIDYPIQIIHHMRSKEEGIIRFAGLVKADLIALGTHGRHGLTRFFKGSVAEGVVNHSSLPVLTINFHKKMMNRRNELRTENRGIEKAAVMEDMYYSGHTLFI